MASQPAKHGLGEFDGRRVEKPFPKPRTREPGLFKGTAHWMGPEEAPPYDYQVVYDDDDDMELMDRREVRKWLVLD
jgi:hypothetical protein